MSLPPRLCLRVPKVQLTLRESDGTTAKTTLLAVGFTSLNSYVPRDRTTHIVTSGSWDTAVGSQPSSTASTHDRV